MPLPPHAAHIAVLGNFCLGSRLRWRNAGVVGAPDNYVLDRVEVVPRTYDGIDHFGTPFCFISPSNQNAEDAEMGRAWQLGKDGACRCVGT